MKQLPYADAMAKTLVFAIYDFDRFSKHDQIGEVKVPLCQVDLAQTIEEWADVTSVEGEGGQVPPLSYSLSIRRTCVARGCGRARAAAPRPRRGPRARSPRPPHGRPASSVLEVDERLTPCAV